MLTRQRVGPVALLAMVSCLWGPACAPPRCETKADTGGEEASCDVPAPAELCLLEPEPEIAPEQSFDDLVACDPRDLVRKPTRIQPAVAAGRRSDGSIVVIDGLGAGLARLFVSEGSTLVQQRGGGFGVSLDASGYSYDAYRSRSGSLTLLLRRKRPQRKSGHLGPDEFLLAVGDSLTADELSREDAVVQAAYERALGAAERLDSLQECVVKEYTVSEPFPPEIDFIATDQDGNLLVVETTYETTLGIGMESFVFYGPRDAVEQRDGAVHIVERDGGTTVTKFLVGDTEAELYYPAQCDRGPTPFDCPGELTIGDRKLSVSPKSWDRSLIETARFLCARPVAPVE